MSWLRRWFLRRAELARADVVHERKECGFSYTPSDWARTGARLERLDRWIARLNTQEGSGG